MPWLPFYSIRALLIFTLHMTSRNLEKELYDDLYSSTYYLLNADRDLYQAEQAIMGLVTHNMLGTGDVDTYLRVYEENIEQVKDRVTRASDILLADTDLDRAEMVTYFADFFVELNVWEQGVSQLLAQDQLVNASQMDVLRDDFDQARATLDLIQEDLELYAINTISDIQRNNNVTTTITSILMFLFMIIIFVLGFLLIRSITKPIAQLVSNFAQISHGNLQVEASDVDRQDEIGQLASSSNMMIHYLRNMVEKIQHLSQATGRQSEELKQSANEVSIGAEQVAATMEQLSAGVEEQVSSSMGVTGLVEALNVQINEANEDGQNLDRVAKEVYKLSNDGKLEMVQSVELMNDITTMVTESVEMVRELEQRSEKISELTDVIQNIAGQTNLLALNAAIEAARAGESGQGFAIVAGEVRTLAEQVEASVNEITEIIGGVQSDTKSVVESLEMGQRKVEDGNKQLGVSRDSFESINEGVTGMMESIQRVAASLSHISENAQNVNDSVNDIASISEQSAAGIEQSSATAQQQSSSMQEIAASAELLFNLSEDLEETIKQFKI